VARRRRWINSRPSSPPSRCKRGANGWGRVGPALVDGGAPFGARLAVSDDGTNPAPSDQNGYTIVEADSLDAARALTDGHPFLSEGKGRFSVEIFELVPM